MKPGRRVQRSSSVTCHTTVFDFVKSKSLPETKRTSRKAWTNFLSIIEDLEKFAAGADEKEGGEADGWQSLDQTSWGAPGDNSTRSRDRDYFDGAAQVRDASCVTYSDMWRQAEVCLERNKLPNENMQDRGNAVNPHVMVGSLKSAPCPESMFATQPLCKASRAICSGAGSAWDCERDNDVLRHFWRDGRSNLVYDSFCPEKAPHIVVSKVQDTWQDHSVAWCNRVDMQWPTFLMVPPTNIPVFLPLPPGVYWHPEEDSRVEAPIVMEKPKSLTSRAPHPVFSWMAFNRYIESTSTERLILCQVVVVLQKQKLRVASFEASVIAASTRSRYASPDFFRSVEKELKWVDPARDILTFLAKTRPTNITLIDSHCPFVAPHIMITAPPPQDPRIIWQNSTNNPQDSGYGRYLVVPARSVEVINEPLQDWEIEGSLCPSDADPLESSSSQPDVPLPETPVDDYDPDIFIYPGSGVDTTANGAECSEHLSLLDLPIPDNRSCDADFSCTSRPIFTDYDEDDLPPFDEWYQCVL